MSPANQGWRDAIVGFALFSALTSFCDSAPAVTHTLQETSMQIHHGAASAARLPDPTIKTASGLYFNLLEPRQEAVRIEDIAHGLSNLCRFTGHTRHFYSVAQHSYLVSTQVPVEDALVALLHDASEAYIADISRPLKPYLTNYAQIETRLMEVILRSFGLPTELPRSVKRADMVLLATEKRDLMPPVEGEPDWDALAGVEPLNYCIHPCSPPVAKYLFLDRFNELTGEKRS